MGWLAVAARGLLVAATSGRVRRCWANGWACDRHSVSTASWRKPDLTQFYQGVASGGNEQAFRYGAKMNLMLLGDTEKMGLWKGGKIIFHAAEWQFGQTIADAVGLAPVNTNLLLPETEPSFAITHLQYIHGLTSNGWVNLWTVQSD